MKIIDAIAMPDSNGQFARKNHFHDVERDWHLAVLPPYEGVAGVGCAPPAKQAD